MTDDIILYIICEGQSEETFVKELLSPELSPKGIFCIPFCLTTSVKSKTYRGGMCGYTRAKKDIQHTLKHKDAFVTTMFDFYKLSDDFPGKEIASHESDPYEKIRILEECLKDDINNRRFIPYIQLHEFETLLYSNIHCIDQIMRRSSETKLNKLEEIRHLFPNPEKINDGENTAPSKRLISLYPSYQKVTNGVIIAKLITIEKMQEECQHFNEWIGKIEHITDSH